MSHLTEEDLILHHYGEASDPSRVEVHLARCERCRAERERLAADLSLLGALPEPRPDETYGRRVWSALRPRLREKKPAWTLAAFRPWALAASMAALLAAAFLAGRLSSRGREAAGPLARQVRERILLAAVADHLDRSQVVLLEFVHGSGSTPADEASERQWAERLLEANRLYRQTAARDGEAGMASVLDELERLLLEIAHSPSAEAREGLRHRIDSEGTLFKIRVLRSQVRAREGPPAPAAARS
ncbi:MAG: hypothetical protein ACM3SU_14505 [Acidobacteriota bacterium]